jgi:uncharacterized membrane protein
MLVSSVLDVCMWFIYMDVTKVDRDVTYIASVSEAYCCKRLFEMLHTYVAVSVGNVNLINH